MDSEKEIPKVDDSGKPFADYTADERRRYAARAFKDNPNIKGVYLAKLFGIDSIQISKDKKTEAFQEAYKAYGGELLRRAKDKTFTLLEKAVDAALNEIDNGRYDHVVDYDLSDDVIKKQLSLQTVMIKAGSDTIKMGLQAAMHISDQTRMMKDADEEEEDRWIKLAKALAGE